MQDLILNILFCCIFLVLGGLVIGTRKKIDIQGFDYRILLGIFIAIHGIFILLSLFEFSIYQQKFQYIFTLGLANAILVAVSMLILFKRKYLLISFIGGIYFIIEGAFVMISATAQELQILSFVFVLLPSIGFIATTLVIILKKRKEYILFNTTLMVIANFGIPISYAFRSIMIIGSLYWLFLIMLLVSVTLILLSLLPGLMKGLEKKNLAMKVAMTSMFTALGVVLSFLNPFGYFYLGGFKINPFAHLINAIAGVFLGPFWAVIAATFIAIIRFSAGIGSIFAFPGGIPGALVVGCVALIFSLIKKEKYRIYAAFFEVVGTVGIGAVISFLFMDAASTIFLWGGFAISSLLGSSIGFIILWILQKRNITYVEFGESLIV